MGEALAVFLVLMYDIVLTLLVGFIIYCLIAKRVITASGWAYRDRDPGEYRRRMLVLILVTIILGVVRLIPFPF